MSRKTLFILSLVIAVSSCKKDDVENPYDSIEIISNENPDFGAVSSTNFAYLHEKVFKPTCANSGCHDGTFEPEFRSISGAYNSLVNHPVISNDELNSYTKRVVPGSFSQSLLNARLTQFLPNTSGIMPLEVDENSDWDQMSEQYISLIQNWITSGAPDLFGNLPGNGSVDLPPTVNGLVIFPSGNTDSPFERDPNAIGITPILVSSSQVDIWILAQDDQAASLDLPVVELKYSNTLASLENSSTIPYSSLETLNALDFSDNNATFYHKATIDLSAYPSGTNIYLRNILNDGNQEENIELPNTNSSQVITSIFVLQIQ